MLKKTVRLNKTKDIEQVLKKGQKAYTAFLMVKFLKNTLPSSRLGLIVSNKVSKKATQRNLIKRRLRAIIGLAFSRLKPGIDLIIIASPKIITSQGNVLEYKVLEQALLEILQRNRLLI